AAEAARIAARYPGAIEVHTDQPRDVILDALGGYDVLLANSLRDGMNLVAQEGPMVNTADGCLVLSSATGSAGLLGRHALLLADPRSVAETATRLEEGLAMPLEERQRRADDMRAAICAHRPEGWICAQLADLRAICTEGRPLSCAR